MHVRRTIEGFFMSFISEIVACVDGNYVIFDYFCFFGHISSLTKLLLPNTKVDLVLKKNHIGTTYTSV